MSLESLLTGPDASPTTSSVDGDPFEGLPLLLTVPKAAALLGLSRASAYRYATCGDLPTRRLGGRVYVVTAGIRALLEELPRRGEVA